MMSFYNRLLVFIGLLLLWCFAGFTSFWTDSEMWPTVIIRYWGVPDSRFDYSIKPLFNLLLAVTYYVGGFLDFHPMDTARGLMFLNALFCVYLFFRIIRNLTGSSEMALVFAALWASHSFFIKRFIHVRSDLLATTALLALLTLMSDPRWKIRSKASMITLVVLFAALGISATPKAVLVFGPWCALVFWREFSPRVRWLLTTLMGVSVAVIAVWAIEHSHAFKFFIRSFSGSSLVPYFSWIRVSHVLSWMIENFIFAVAMIFSVGYGLIRRPRISAEHRPYFDLTLVLLFLLLAYPEPLPFFVAALSPFFLISFAIAVSQIGMQTRVLKLLFIISLLQGTFWSAWLIRQHNAFEQRRYVKWINSLGPELKGRTLVDPVGLIHKFEPLYWFLGPHEPTWNTGFADFLEENRADFILPSPRFMYGGDELDQYLVRNYAAGTNGILRRQLRLELKDREVEVMTILSIMEGHFALDSMERSFEIQVRGLGDNDLTDDANLRSAAGEKMPIPKSVSLAELTQMEAITVGPGASEILIMPSELSSPPEDFLPFATLFRFDPEI